MIYTFSKLIMNRMTVHRQQLFMDFDKFFNTVSHKKLGQAIER